MRREDLIPGKFYKSGSTNKEVYFVAPAHERKKTHFIDMCGIYKYDTCCTVVEDSFIPLTDKEIRETLEKFPQNIVDQYRHHLVNNSYSLY